MSARSGGALRLDRVAAHIGWEARDVWRRVSAHPLTTILLVLGLPAILSAYALFGHLVSELLLGAFERGPDAFAAEVTRAARVFAVLLVLMGSGGVIGNLFHSRPREMLARYRPLPLTDAELWIARRCWEDGAFLVLVLLPMFGVASARLLIAGLGPFISGLVFAAPLLLATLCLVGVRTTVLVGLLLFPRRFLSWRAALWLLILAAALLVRPAAELASRMWSSSSQLVFPPTDWVGGAARAFAGGDRAAAFRICAGALGVALLAVAVDFAVFRAIALRHFDAIQAKLYGSGLLGGRRDLVAAALDRLPDTLLGLPLRGLLKKDALRLLRDPVLSLSLQVPVLVVALSAALSEVAILGYQHGALTNPSLGALTRYAAFGVLGALLVLGGASQAVLAIAWEGDRLGPVRACPLGDRRLWQAKARTAGILCALCWVAVYAVAYAWTGPWPGVPAWCGVLALPLAIALAALATGRAGAAAGAVFAQPRAKNPLFAVGLVGLGVQFLLAAAALGAALLAALGPALLGPALAFLAPALLVVWLLAQPVLRDEGVRALRRIRAR